MTPTCLIVGLIALPLAILLTDLLHDYLRRRRLRAADHTTEALRRGAAARLTSTIPRDKE